MTRTTYLPYSPTTLLRHSSTPLARPVQRLFRLGVTRQIARRSRLDRDSRIFRRFARVENDYLERRQSLSRRLRQPRRSGATTVHKPHRWRQLCRLALLSEPRQIEGPHVAAPVQSVEIDHYPF